MTQRNRGVTLVEMLVVLAIIGVMLALLMPAVQNARLAGKRVHCANNLKQIGIAMHNRSTSQGNTYVEPIPSNQISWRVALLPFLEEFAIETKYRKDSAWDSPENTPLMDLIPKAFVCPLSNAGSSGRSSYESPGVFYGLVAAMPPDAMRQKADPARLRSQRPIATEVSDEYSRPWLDPNFDPRLTGLLDPTNGIQDRLKRAFGGNHGTIFPILFADGHVRFYSTSVDTRPLFEVFAGVRDAAELEQ